MEKGCETWRSALQRPSGIVLDVPLCRSVGCSHVIQAGNVPPFALFSTDQTQTAEQIIRDAHEAMELGKYIRGESSSLGD